MLYSFKDYLEAIIKTREKASNITDKRLKISVVKLIKVKKLKNLIKFKKFAKFKKLKAILPKTAFKNKPFQTLELSLVFIK